MPLLMCVLAALPFPAAQLFFSVNHGVRLITPAFMPALAGVAILTALTPLLRWRVTVLAVAAVIGWQIQSELVPSNIFESDSWDMEPLYTAASQHGIVAPRIGLIGYHWNFDIEALATPFLERGRIPEVSRLWDYSMPWDITAIQTAAQWDDILVVPPDYKGLEMARDKGDQDNVHNADFDRWIRQSGLFEGPQSFTVGRDRSVVVNVYFKLKPPTTEAGSVR